MLDAIPRNLSTKSASNPKIPRRLKIGTVLKIELSKVGYICSMTNGSVRFVKHSSESKTTRTGAFTSLDLLTKKET